MNNLLKGIQLPSGILPETQLLLQTPGKMISRAEFNSLPTLDQEAIYADERDALTRLTARRKEQYSRIPFYAERAKKEGEEYWTYLARCEPGFWKRTTKG